MFLEMQYLLCTFFTHFYSFTGILTVPSEMIGAELRVASISEKILLNGSILIQNDSATPFYLASELPTGNGRLSLGNLEEGVYRISIGIGVSQGRLFFVLVSIAIISIP